MARIRKRSSPALSAGLAFEGPCGGWLVVPGFAAWRNGLSALRPPFTAVAPQFIVSLRKAREDLPGYGCRYGASVRHRRLFGAERTHDEWQLVGRWLDGWIRRDIAADLPCPRGRRPRGMGRPAQGEAIAGARSAAPRRCARVEVSAALGKFWCLAGMTCRGPPDSPPNRSSSERIEHPRDRACGQLLGGMKDETR
jgi:hypothetical protein